ncbi:MAG: hypothetical protein M1831_002613 [Alyxoria varia]|nr:MAG: hypothetical protein M1831_002613 [Alyxoria varia]
MGAYLFKCAPFFKRATHILLKNAKRKSGLCDVGEESVFHELFPRNICSTLGDPAVWVRQELIFELRDAIATSTPPQDFNCLGCTENTGIVADIDPVDFHKDLDAVLDKIETRDEVSAPRLVLDVHRDVKNFMDEGPPRLKKKALSSASFSPM